VPHFAVEVETALPPEAVRDALLDFSERRPELWPNLDPRFYEVHSVGETTADVSEGTKLPIGSIRAREQYDWSEPNVVRWTVVESNFSAPGGRVIVSLSPREGGGTRMHIDWERTGTTLAGRALIRLLALTKGRPIASSVRKALQRLEQTEHRSG
jgi:hypothetical protein